MTIKVGDRIPAVTLYKMGAKKPDAISTAAIFDGKKVVLFALPGAFTPTCSNAHLPGFVVQADNIRARGVDTIACLAVNDGYVMAAWGEAQNAGEILMLADSTAAFTRALGTELDMSAVGMGTRSARYVMIVDDGVVSFFALEQPREFKVSSAEAVLEALSAPVSA